MASTICIVTIVLSVILLAGCGALLPQTPPSSPIDIASWVLPLNLGDSTDALALWVSQHVVFQSDQMQYGLADYWASPEETMANGRGDCEDMALLMLWLCKEWLCVEGDMVIGYNGNVEHAWARVSDGEWDLKTGERMSYIGFRVDRVLSYGEVISLVGWSTRR